jgi:hypothetical protein
MVPALREEFNRNFTAAKYRQFLQKLDEAAARTSTFASRRRRASSPRACSTAWRKMAVNWSRNW